MKTLARYVPFAAVLGALLVFAGCTTQTARAVSPRVSYRVSLVENSKNLHLTPAKTAEIRASALNYLKENGLDRGGEYFVKVNLTPDQPEDAGEWVVLRISSMPTRTYTLLAAYPGPDDSYPDDSYFYGYSNYGYPSFARYGYYDPLDYGYYNNYGGYGGGVYVPPRDHNRPDHNKPDYNRPGDRDNRPPGTPRTRWDSNRSNPDRNHSDDNRPRTDTPRTWNRDRSHDGNSGSSWSGRDGSHGSSSDSNGSSGGSSASGSSSGSSYSPPPPPAPEPAPRSDPPQTESGRIYPAK